MKSSSTPLPIASAGLVARLAARYQSDPSSHTGQGVLGRIFARIGLAAPKPKLSGLDAEMAKLEQAFNRLPSESAKQAFAEKVANQIRAASKPRQQHSVRRAQFAVMPAKAQAGFIRGGGRIVD
jgi:hypothetical protein